MLIAVMLASPAHAKWHYCYSGTPPVGVNTYTDMPPRTFGFEMALLPATFQRLCGGDANAEADHVRRIVAEYLECTAGSDLARRIDGVLTATPAKAMMEYFGQPRLPESDEWDAVCFAAKQASVATLAFGDTWYFDSDTADEDGARLRDLIAALEALSLSLAANNPNGDSDG